MIKTIWILPPSQEKVNELMRRKMYCHRNDVMFHSSAQTANIQYAENIRLQGETFREKVDHLEEILEQIANQKYKIQIIVDANGSELTQAAIHFCLTHFPLITEIETATELWRNPDIHWELEEVYHTAHHLIVMNKYTSAELLLKSYVEDKNIFHLLTFGNRLLNGNAKFNGTNQDYFYFDLLANVLSELVEENRKEVNYVYTMRDLIKSKQRTFIYFLQNYCRQLYKKKELVDFIVLYYRLAEELLLYAMGWDVDNSNQYWVRKNAKKSVPFERPQSRHFSSYINIVLLKAEKNPTNKYLQRLSKDFTQHWLLDFLDLRHEGISGHGFVHYSTELFEEICAGNPLEKMDDLLRKYGMKAEFDLFELIQKAILALVRGALVQPVR